MRVTTPLNRLCFDLMRRAMLRDPEDTPAIERPHRPIEKTLSRRCLGAGLYPLRSEPPKTS